MFAQLLRETRAEAGMTQAELAARSGTSRAAIADYETGRKNPRTDTAERVLNALGATMTVARLGRSPRYAMFNRGDAARLRQTRTSPVLAVDRARSQASEIIESDCAVEGIKLSWGEVRVLSEGITIGGEPLGTWRATEIARSVRAELKRSVNAAPRPLRTVANGTLVEADEFEPDGERQLQYLVTAIAAGADSTLTLHTVSSALVHEGYPWLFVRYSAVEQYRKALVKTKRTGDGDDLVRILVDGIEGW